MRIAQLAPLWKPVPPPLYGGSELVVHNLTEALVKSGHQVTLFACGGSVTSANLVEVIPRPMYDMLGGFNWQMISPYEFLGYAELFERLQDFDIVHNHMGFHPLVFAPLLPCPVITTNHSSLPPDFPFLIDTVKDSNFVSISQSQRSLAPSLKYVATVYHGIETAAFRPEFRTEQDYFLFLGTLSRSKGIGEAVTACRKGGQKLVIAGEIRQEEKEFLDREVFPHVDGQQISFVGEVGHAKKEELLRGAKALLFPISWKEAFGLVMAESLACGTPVIAYPSGSVPEIITDGRTGLLANNSDELIEKMKEIGRISRQECRLECERRFDRSVMADRYLETYQKLIG